MAVFEPEEFPLFDVSTAKRVNRNFQQKPRRIPLELPLQPTFVIKEEQNVLPIVAVVSIFAFFGFLAFLAFMRRS